MADVAVDLENKNPKELLGQGIRAYILQDFSTAVEALGKASELLAAEYGDDLHESLGEVYFYYGKALLGLAREEAQPLGDAVPKDASDSEDDETEDTEENDEKGEENGEESKTENHESQEDKDKTVTNGSSAPASSAGALAPPNSAAGSSTSSVVAAEAVSAEDTPGEAENEEPTDLQVAWEVLELAKKIYKKNEDLYKKNLAETLIALGEVSLESENFESAINDIKEGLEIQKSLFGKDNRTIAETYYNLGVAYSINSQIDEAIESFKSSLEYLKNRIDVLEKVEDKKDESEEEIKEIKDLIPDIEEKINDMKSYKEETIKKITEAVKEAPKEANLATTSTKQAMDISHLVKRKRKLEDIVEEKNQDDSPAKKPAPST